LSVDGMSQEGGNYWGYALGQLDTSVLGDTAKRNYHDLEARKFCSDIYKERKNPAFTMFRHYKM